MKKVFFLFRHCGKRSDEAISSGSPKKKIASAIKPPRNDIEWNNQKGVGLVELMVAVLIMAGLISALMASYTTMPGITGKGNLQAILQQDASLAMEEMTKAIRGTASAALAVTANQITTTRGIYNVSDGLLKKNNSEILLGDSTFDNFSMSVSGLTFSDNYPTKNSIEITLSVNLLETISGGGTTVLETRTFHTEVYPRNRT